ncbi:MAG: DUF1684 domain-containing protein [Microbacterium sp.]|uniref:DUF1684 domain-containing protein n=1 Tax=Microbacterium sp. TaxID=51671 RepID=UPI0039E36B90
MTETTTADSVEYAAGHARWHEQVEERRTSPYGPLSVTSIHWLTATSQRFGGVPGAWREEPAGVAVVDLDDGERLELDAEQFTGTFEVGPLSGIETRTLVAGDLRVEIAARGGSLVLRTRDPRSPDLIAYEGTEVFPPHPRWRVEARFVPQRRPEVRVESIVPDRPQHYDSPGVAEFELDGRPLRLTLFGDGDALRAIFADTSDRTFPAARNVEVVRTGPETVVIDFNRSTNPPCAYSAGATCPLPPPGNRLPIPIEAGEIAPATSPEH